MMTTLVCALLMLLCAAILFFYPQGYNQYHRYDDAEVRRAYHRHLHLWGGVGSVVIAAVLAAGALWLRHDGTGDTGLTIFNIMTITIGVIVMVGGIESFKVRK